MADLTAAFKDSQPADGEANYRLYFVEVDAGEFEFVISGANGDVRVLRLSQSQITGLSDIVSGLFSGAYNDLSGKPTLGTAAATDADAYDAAGSAASALNLAVQRGNHTGAQPQSTVTDLVSDLAAKIAITQIVNDLTTGGTAVPLSAEAGKALNALITALTTTVAGKASSTVIADYLTPVTLTSASSLTWNVRTGPKADLTIAHDVTLTLDADGATSDISGRLLLKQDSTAGRALSAVNAADSGTVDITSGAASDVADGTAGEFVWVYVDYSATNNLWDVIIKPATAYGA